MTSTCKTSSSERRLRQICRHLCNNYSQNNKAQTRTVDLCGKRALVTGAGRGIGRAIAERLHQCGATVVGLDVDGNTLKGLQAALGCDTVQCNLLNVVEIDNKVEAYIARAGAFHLLVNCAGVAQFEKYFETTNEAFDFQYAVNVRAVARLTQTVTKAMVAHKIVGGSVVHISSASSTLPVADHLAYSCGKAAVDHMARIQALELGVHGIRVNTVRPTVVMTELARKQWAPADLEVLKSQIPLRKLATTEDVALAVSWLLSDEASMVTGSTLAVDGGRSMGGFGM